MPRFKQTDYGLKFVPVDFVGLKGPGSNIFLGHLHCTGNQLERAPFLNLLTIIPMSRRAFGNLVPRAAIQRGIFVVACTISGCVSTAPIPSAYQGDLSLKGDGYISPCTQWTSTFRTWVSGPVPVTCLLIGPVQPPNRPVTRVIPAGTRVRILSFQDFNGVDAQSMVVRARVFADGQEIDAYLDSRRLAEYF